MNPEGIPSPAFALVRREFLVLARNPRLFGLMAGITTVLALAALVSLSFTSLRYGQMAGFARSIFGTQFFLLYAAALIVVPAMAAAAIVHERKQDCYPLILTTLIPPGWIVWSKLIALMGLYAGLYAGVLPFTGIIYFFAGVEPLALLQGALVSFSLALGTASIGLLASSSAKDHSQALYHTALGVLCMVFLPWAASVVLQMLGLPRMGWLQAIGPSSAYAVVSSGLPDWRLPLAFALYQGCVSLCCITLTRRHVFRGDPVAPAGILSSWPSLTYRNRSEDFRPIPDGINPIAEKDLRANRLTKGIGRWGMGALGLAAGSAGYFLTGVVGPMESPLFEQFFLFIFVPPMAAAAVIAECEQDMFESLRTTLLTGTEIACGKVAGVIRSIYPFAIGSILGRVLLYTMMAITNGSVYPGDDRFAPLNPLPLLVCCLELALYLNVIPRIALFDPVNRSNAMAATLGSYASVLLALILVSIVNGLFTVVIPFGESDSMFAFVACRIPKYAALLLAGWIAMDSASNNYNYKIRGYDYILSNQRRNGV